MSFSDVARYMQGGFDEPVQLALAGHIKYCNACQDELDRVQAIMSTGKHLMGSDIVGTEAANSDSMISEALVAAYVDGGLSEKERNLVTQHLADNYQSFSVFSSIEQDLGEPISYSAPNVALDKVKVDVPIPVPSYVDELRSQAKAMLSSAQQLFELKWPAPALAFAVGVIAMLMIVPASRTIIPLPGAGVQVNEQGKIHSGVGFDDAASTGAVVTIPESVEGDVTFTWAPVQSATYRAELSEEGSDSVIETINTDSPSWDFDSARLKPGVSYILFVTASTAEAGIRPVATINVIKQ